MALPIKQDGTVSTVPITATFNVPLSRISDLLVSAFEGGSNYWYFINSQGTLGHPADVVLEGGWLHITSLEGDEHNGVKEWTLDLEACKRGLQLMANASWKGVESCQQPLRFWNDFMAENDDAETADVFLQLCLFGEIIYG